MSSTFTPAFPPPSSRTTPSAPAPSAPALSDKPSRDAQKTVMGPSTHVSSTPRPAAPHHNKRSSSSSSLHRHLLDLYVKHRRFSPDALLRAPAIFTVLVLVALATIWSLSASLHVRAVTAQSLRSLGSAARHVAYYVEVRTAEGGGGKGAAGLADADRVAEGRKRSPLTFSSMQDREQEESGSTQSSTADDVREPVAATSYTPQHPESSDRDSARDEHAHLTDINYTTPRNVPQNHTSLKESLEEPPECSLWRQIARNTSEVYPYRKHFASLDVIDWFTYLALFDEAFHATAISQHRRPRYLDVAANHARRWSNTWFYDRCMGWDGVCAEANSKYHPELREERHCHLIPTCVSDEARTVRFAMTNAWGGVVRGDGEKYGVDGELHASEEKFKDEFAGFEELKCTTLRTELERLDMQHFDFMSLDVEGHEMPILMGIDWEKTKIDVIVTENKTPPVQDLLHKQGYTLYPDLLKDYLYIRNDTGMAVAEEFVELSKRLDRKTYRFAPEPMS